MAHRCRVRRGCVQATSSTWRAAGCASARRDGRRILDVEDGSGGNLTVPPEAPLVEVVSGGSEDGEERIEAVTFRRPDTQAATDRRIAPRVARRRARCRARVGDVVFRDRSRREDRRRSGRQCGPDARRPRVARGWQPLRASRRLHRRDPAQGLRAFARAGQGDGRAEPVLPVTGWQSCRASCRYRRRSPLESSSQARTSARRPARSGCRPAVTRYSSRRRGTCRSRQPSTSRAWNSRSR